MRILAFVISMLLCFFFAGCEGAALKYAKGIHSGCRVVQIEKRGDSVKVLVTCPYQDPYERVYQGR